VARLLPGEERAQAGGVTRVGVRCTASFGIFLSESRLAVKSRGFLLGDTNGSLKKSCWRGSFFLLRAGLVYSMNRNWVESCSVRNPCSLTVGQRLIFAISGLSSLRVVSSRTNPASFVSPDYTRGDTRIGFIGAKRLNALSERPRSPTLTRGATRAGAKRQARGVTRVSVGCTALFDLISIDSDEHL
jgi:hypothetical protein